MTKARELSELGSYLNVSGGVASVNNITVSSNLEINVVVANGSVGTAGQMLTSNGSGVYWLSPQIGDITNVIAGTGLTGGGSSGEVTVSLATSGVVANTYGNSSSIPVITVDTYGRLTNVSTAAAAVVTNFTYTGANNTFSISTGDGSTFTANITAANATLAGVVTVLDSVVNTSILIAASANSVKNAYDRAIDANTRAASAQTAAISAYSNATSYADSAAATAYSNAVSVASADATNKAANAYSNAVSYAATIAGTAYSNAVSTAAADATSKANNAYTTAVAAAASDATNKAANAYSNAVSYAATIAGTAYSNAVSTAAADATSKANNAYTTAVAAAASDATTKANNAYTTAVSAASTDATNKAANAYSNAVTYASNASNISSGTLAEARLPYRMDQNVRTTDTVQFGNMTVTGNLTVSGTTVTVSANNLVLQDNMIYLNDGNTVANPDLGIAGNYNDGTYRHAGFFRDATDGVWKVYDQYLPEPDASPYIDTSNASFRIANFQANVVTMASANASGSFDPSTWTNAAFKGQGAYGGGLAFVDGAAGFGLYVQDTGTNFIIGQGSASGALSEKVRITSAGNVGIGTTSPAARLDLGTASATNQIQAILARQYGGDGNFRLVAKTGTGTAVSSEFFKVGITYADTDNAFINFYRGGDTTGGFLTFSTNNNTERMRIAADGSVGIGTSSPASKLHIQGSAPELRLYSDTTTGSTINFIDQSWQSQIVGSGGSIAFNAGGTTERMRIDSGGNVGIGTNSPTRNIHIQSGGTDPGILITTSGGANPSYIFLDSSDSNILDIENPNGIAFNGTSGVERMRITSAGDVGIGTTAPAGYGRLAVIGNIASSADGATVLTMRANAGGTNLGSYNATGSYLAFQTNASGSGEVERMRITTAGDVGIGTSSPDGILHVRGNIIRLDKTGTAEPTIRFRSANDSYSSEWGVGHRSSSNDFAIRWFDGSSTWSERFSITTAGNVGIGTGSPAGKLAVASSSSNGTTISAWSSSHTIFGPNVGSTTGAALGLGYNTATDTAEIVSIAPGVAWKNLWISAVTTDLNTISGRVQTNQSFRAPIFYDSADSGYFLDLKDQFNNTYAKSLGGFYVDATGHYFRSTASAQWAGIDSDFLYHYSDIRSGLFYDYDNTTYYLDPASTSVLNDVIVAGNISIGNTIGDPLNGFRIDAYNNDLAIVGGSSTGAAVGTSISFRTAPAGGGEINRMAIDADGNVVMYGGSLFAGTGTVQSSGGFSAYDSSGGDPYAKVSVTRNTDANYAYYGLTRYGQMVYQMGIDTSNRFWIGGGTAGHNGVRNDTYLSFSTAGDVTAKGDFRAPLFYDSNNTAYFLDAASGSTSLFTAGLLRTYGWVQAGYLTGGVAMTTNDGYGNANITWNHIGGTPEQNGNSGRIVVNTDATSGVYMDFQVKSNVTSGVAVGLTSALTAYETYTEIKNSTRSPIYYDSNNTAYWVDPASNSVLTSFNLGGGETYVYSGATNALNVRTGAGGSYKYFGFEAGGRFVVSNGGIFSGGYLDIQYNSGNEYAGMGIRNNYGSASLQATGFIDFINENGFQKASLFGVIATDGAGYLQFLSTAPAVSRSADSRTTTAYAYHNQWSFQTSAGIATNILYDRDNSTYYLDPSSSTVIENLAIRGSVYSVFDSAQYYDAAIEVRERNLGGAQADSFNNAPRLGFHWGGRVAMQLALDSSTVLNVMNGDCTGWTAFRAGDMYGNAFYDRGDTSYYVDPTSTSVLNNLNVLNDIYITRTTNEYGFIVRPNSVGYKKLQFAVVGGGALEEVVANTTTLRSTGDVRGSIFYDTNNTAYYADPTGTSVFNALTVAGSPVMRGKGYAGSNNVDWNTLGNDHNAIYQANQETFNIGGGTGNSNFPTTASYKYGAIINFSANAEARAQMYISHAGNDLIFRGGWGESSWQTWNKVLTDINYNSYVPTLTGTGASGTWGISITGNAATASNLTSTRANWGSTSVLSAVVGQLAWRNYGSNHTIFDASAGLTPDGTAVNNTNSQIGWAGTYPTLMGWNGSETYGVRVDSARLADGPSGSTFTASGDFRAPIFYDSNDTTYRIDGNGTSVLAALRVNYSAAGYVLQDYGWLVAQDSSARGISIGYDPSADRTWMYSRHVGVAGKPISLNDILIVGAGGGFTTSAGSVRTPIFYDSDNTGYYLDPSATGISLDIKGDIRSKRLDSGSGASWDTEIFIGETSNSEVNGTFPTSITGYGLSVRKNSDGAFLGLVTRDGGTNFDTVLGWGDDSDDTLFFRFNNVNKAYLNSSAVLYAAGDVRAPIFYNSNDTTQRWDGNSLILRGGSPTVYFRDTDANSAMIHVNSNLFYILRGGNDTESWSTAVNSAWPLQINLTNNDAQFGANLTALNGMYAQIYYDRDNTGYYLDPNTSGTSLNVRGYINNPTMWVNNGDDYNNYNEGIRLRSAPNGVSVIAFNAAGAAGQPTSSILGFSDRHEVRWGGDWQTRVRSGYAEAAGSYRAPIFYDNDNTGYYVNPNGSSVLFNTELINLRCKFDRSWDNYPGIIVYNTTDQGPQADFRIHGGPGANGGDFGVRLLVDGDITSLVNVNAGNAMYTPIYYDSNDSGYYFNGAGYSSSYRMYIQEKFYARGNTGVDECCGSDATISVGGSSTRPPSISFHYSGVMQGNMQGNQTGWRKIYFYDDQGSGLGVHATGQIASNADVIAYYSDKRLKKDLARVVDHWNVINNLTGYRFTWNEKSGEIPGFQDKVGKREVGLIAQDVQAVYPEAIAMRTEGPEDDPYMTIKHDRFTAVFIEALKDLRRELDEVKEENKKLREMINGQ